jgi:hypothetical protein
MVAPAAARRIPRSGQSVAPIGLRRLVAHPVRRPTSGAYTAGPRLEESLGGAVDRVSGGTHSQLERLPDGVHLAIFRHDYLHPRMRLELQLTIRVPPGTAWLDVQTTARAANVDVYHRVLRAHVRFVAPSASVVARDPFGGWPGLSSGPLEAPRPWWRFW